MCSSDLFRPLLPDIHLINYNNFENLNDINHQTAAVFIETIQGEAGIIPPTLGYLQALRQRCDEVGALLVLDEIQAGMGRTGALWAFEQYNIVPDVLLLAKGLGGGMPIGAFISSKEIMSSLTDDPILGHITTFGGHPVSCAAAYATLKILVETDLVAEAKSKGLLFKSLLVHHKIIGIRQVGLWLAVELESFDFLQKVIQHCLKNGLLTDWFLFNNRSLRIAPPLIITEGEIRWACAVILKAVDESI